MSNMVAPTPPDLAYDDRTSGAIRPSWSANPGYVDQGHREIFAKTQMLPGWQVEGDSHKLYEMAHFSGDVMLEIGVYGGRSAVVELRGALSNPQRAHRPQFFGIDNDPKAIQRSHDVLTAAGLADDALLYLGDIQEFAARFPIRPTMVFVDGDHSYEGATRDFTSLGGLLTPGVPVLCHDYLNVENDAGQYGVRRAASEWEQSGEVKFCGTFGVAALFVTTPRCRGTAVNRWADDDFARERTALLGEYAIGTAAAPPGASAWRTRALAAETELERIRSSRSYRLLSAVSQRLVMPVKRRFSRS
jgi:Methyltransferase domain